MCKDSRPSSRGNTMRRSTFIILNAYCVYIFNSFLIYFIYIINITFRRYLRETLKMANSEDLNRLTSCSLVLLGHIFLSLGNSRESMNMVTPAMQLASKIPDVHVQLWASAILKGKIFSQLLIGSTNLVLQTCIEFVAITSEKMKPYNATWISRRCYWTTTSRLL